MILLDPPTRHREPGRASEVPLADGQRIAPGYAVLTDVSAPCLYRDLIGLQRLPDRLVQDLGRFQWDAATVKVNWVLSAPVPWTACDARGAGTMHFGVDLNGAPTAWARPIRAGIPPKHGRRP